MRQLHTHGRPKQRQQIRQLVDYRIKLLITDDISTYLYMYVCMRVCVSSDFFYIYMSKNVLSRKIYVHV